jgi:hypothetical protein
VVLIMAGVGVAAVLFVASVWAMIVLLVRMVLRYSEGSPERKEWLLRVGVSVLVPMSRVDVQRLEAERLLVEEQRRAIEAMTELQRLDRTVRLSPGRDR